MLDKLILISPHPKPPDIQTRADVLKHNIMRPPPPPPPPLPPPPPPPPRVHPPVHPDCRLQYFPIALPHPPSPQVLIDAMPVLVFTFNRADSLRKTLDYVFNRLPPSASPTKLQHPIFVSQDGDDMSVINAVSSYGSRVTHLRFPNWTPPSAIESSKYEERWRLYYKIAAHYGWALQQIFDIYGHTRVILLEDDMEISSDFFSYFTKMSEIMDVDQSVMCVSAWNDNGQGRHVRDPLQLYRTDVFPGLGWLLTKRLWDEWGQKWPVKTGFWDDVI